MSNYVLMEILKLCFLVLVLIFFSFEYCLYTVNLLVNPLWKLYRGSFSKLISLDYHKVCICWISTIIIYFSVKRLWKLSSSSDSFFRGGDGPLRSSLLVSVTSVMQSKAVNGLGFYGSLSEYLLLLKKSIDKN